MIAYNLWLLHVGLVALSLSLFLWRGLSMWQGRPLESHFWRRVFPDSIDTVLLLSGITLAYLWGFSPWNDDWLLVKLIAVLCYIFFGIMALRKSGELCHKRVYFMLALMTAAYIVFIAHSKLVCPLC